MSETCTWCGEKQSVGVDGLVSYHDFPKPCRAVCRGAKRLSVEATALNEDHFKATVANYLGDDEATRNTRCAALANYFETYRSWSMRLTTGKARPHPRMKRQIIAWICEQQRAERYSS